ncbi:DUF4304 domain-containing protein [Patescibacteria group bacterium]|jgi:hypothetical protein|nr:DUF4304 domain-containing protein [Patescibacteria group bacterium]
MDVISQIVSLYRENDFKVRKKAKSCYIDLTEDIIFVVNLQGSQWSKCHYVNLGFFLLTDENNNRYPPHYHCQARRRLDVSEGEDKCYDLSKESGLIVQLVDERYVQNLKPIHDIDSLKRTIRGMGFYLSRKGGVIFETEIEKY